MTDGLLPPERSMWRLRVVVDDARGRLAALAMTLSRAGANIHTVEVHPLPDGGALDELLLSTPADGRSSEVLRAAHAAGGRDAALWPCDVHDFVDEPTRVLRLSARVAHDPTQLPAVLAELLHAREGDGDDDRAVLVVATDAGDIRLERSDEPFTPAERAPAWRGRCRRIRGSGRGAPRSVTSRTPASARPSRHPGARTSRRSAPQMQGRAYAWSA